MYLAQSPFTVITDHSALTSLPTNKRYEGRLARWSLFLQQYNYTVQAKKGKQNTNADFLSRIPYNNTQAHTQSFQEPEVFTQEIDFQTTDHTAYTTPNTNSFHTANETKFTEYTLSYPSSQSNIHTHSQSSECNSTRQVNTLTRLIKAEADYQSLDATQHLSEILQINKPTLQDLQQTDPVLQKYINYLKNGTLSDDDKIARTVVLESADYVLDQGILYHLYYPRGKGHKIDRVLKQLVIPETLKHEVLLSYHDAVTADHQGIERTYHAIRLKYFWKNMYSDIQIYIKTCEDCQQSKRATHKHPAPLKPLEIEEPFSTLHIDHIGPLPTSKEGYKYCLLVIDRFTKFPECFATKSTDAVETANILYSQIICRYGFPRKLILDRAQGFMSKLIAELCKIFQITKVNTSSYHPQTNSSAERFNQQIIQHLKMYCSKQQTTWPDLLSSIMLAYRATPAVSSHTYSPYYLLYGREITLALDTALTVSPNLPTSTQGHLNKILKSHETALEVAKENIANAQAKYKKQYDKSCTEPNFQLGQKVWLYCSKIQPGANKKMTRLWTGPFYIVEKYPNYCFKLRKACDNKLVKSLVHANRLKVYYDPATRPTTHPSSIQQLNREFNPELVPDHNTSDSDTPVTSSDPPHTTTSTTGGPTHRTLEVQRIFSSAMVRGRRCYKVKFIGKKNTQWIPASNISEGLIREFHVNKTLTGRRRK